MKGLPYIEDKRLYRAVAFSLSMQRDGIHPDVADKTAGRYFRFARETVARYTEAAPAWMRGRGEPPA
jgi:hypothetical protein